MTKFDLNKFLMCDKENRRIYGKSFGFVTIRCIPSQFTVYYSTNSKFNLDGHHIKRSDYYGYSTPSRSVNIDSIYIAKAQKDKDENGKSVDKYEFIPFSFDKKIRKDDKLVVKIEKEYYEISRCDSLQKINTSILTNEILFKKIFEKREISPYEFEEVLNKIEWEENDADQLIDVGNINILQPGTKVFINDENGGGGIIVKCKEFCAIDKKAIFEIKLYNGNIIDVNWYSGKIKLIVPKTYLNTNNELKNLRISIDEYLLNPFIRGLNCGFNIYWQAVEDAALYTVKLFTWNEESVCNKLYKLESRSVDRNKFYTTFIDLSVGEYYVKVIAENRMGQIVAESKAIKMRVTNSGASILSY